MTVATDLLLEATGVTKTYGAVVALRDASLAVRPREVHALMGANGAGKSTLVKILTAAVQPDGGKITVRGKPWVARSRSHEQTFEHDVTSADEVEAHVVRMARELTGEVVAEGRVVTHVAVKLRTSTFFTRTKIGKLPQPTTDPEAVAAHARVVLSRFQLRRPLRLIGVRVMLDINATQ